MSRATVQRERTLLNIQVLLKKISGIDVNSGSYVIDNHYRQIINAELAPLASAIAFNVKRLGNEELSQLIEVPSSGNDFDAVAYLGTIDNMVKQELEPYVIEELGLVEARYRKAALQLGKIYSSKLGSSRWQLMLRPFLENPEFIQFKDQAIRQAINTNHQNFEKILSTLVRGHESSDRDRLILNESLRALGYEITDTGTIREMDAELGLAEVLGALADKLAGRMARLEVSKPNFEEFEYHRERVADAYYRLDWKSFSAELRNVMEAWIKCISAWDRTGEFKMPEGLNTALGSKAWERDVVYGCYRLVSEDGSHSGLPDRQKSLTAYSILSSVLQAVYRIK